MSEFGPTFLYHITEPKGKIFYDKEEHDQALRDGWKEAPWLIYESESLTITNFQSGEVSTKDYIATIVPDEPKPEKKTRMRRKNDDKDSKQSRPRRRKATGTVRPRRNAQRG